MNTATPSTVLDAVDQKIVSYMASIAGKHPQRFCAPKLESIRFAAAWCEPNELIQSRLEKLCDVGRIERASTVRDGIALKGYVVLSNRLWKEKQRPTSADLVLTEDDRRFLKALRVAW